MCLCQCKVLSERNVAQDKVLPILVSMVVYKLLHC